jgi:protein arginine kinase activator
MKCQQCEKPATFHITELTGPQPQELHLCKEHAQEYLSHANSPEVDDTPDLANVFAQQLKLGQTAEDLAQLDRRACPVCGITFYEFRNQGRLGCPHDYVCFAEELAPLLANIHGEVEHTGKRPKKHGPSENKGTELIRLRRQIREAIEQEDYELASQLRDRIRRLESDLQEGRSD